MTRPAGTEPCPCEEALPRDAGSADGFSGWVTDLVHAHRTQLVAVARREGLGAEDAFDAAQEAFAGFLMLPQARELAPSEWAGRTLVALVRNVARNARRLHAVARPHVSHDEGGEAVAGLADPAPGADERLDARERRGRLARCVARLADVQRAVVTLRMLDDRAGEDVARELGLRPGHVAVLLHRAKADLRACLTGSDSLRDTIAA